MDTRNLDGILLHWPAVCVVIGGRKYVAQTDHFEDEDLCMEIRLEKQGRVWRKHLEVRAKRPLPTPDYVEMDRQTVPDPAMRQCGYLDTGGQVRREGAGEEGGGVIPGCGYPLIGRKIFTGLAHQAGFARIESQDSASTTYSLRHHPVWNGDRLESIEAVFCVSDKPEKDFAEYIESIRAPMPLKPFFAFCSFWSDPYLGNYEYAVTGEAMKSFIGAWHKLGFQPDAFTFDAGWQNRKSFFEPKPGLEFEKYPNLSLWVSHNGPMGIDPDFLRENGIAVGEGFSSAYCGDNYGVLLDRKLERRLTERFCELARHCLHLKIDWDNDCAVSPEFKEKYPTQDHVREGSINAMNRIMDAVRRVNPNLLVRNGWWPSPWWLRHVQHVFLSQSGDSEYASLPALHQRASAATHRDMMYYNHLRRDHSMIPLSSFDNHEFPNSIRNAFDDTESTWTDNLMLCLLRGSTYFTWTVQPESLTPYQAETMRHAMRFARDCAPHLFVKNGCMFGGNPGLGEVYGFLQPGEHESWCVLRNPAPMPQKYRLPESFEHVVQFYPDFRMLEREIVLLPEEVKCVIVSRKKIRLPFALPFQAVKSGTRYEYRFPASETVSANVQPMVAELHRIPELKFEKISFEPGGTSLFFDIVAPYRMHDLRVCMRIRGADAGELRFKAYSSRYYGNVPTSSFALPVTEICSGKTGYGEKKNPETFFRKQERYFTFPVPAGGRTSFDLEFSRKTAPGALELWCIGYEDVSAGCLKRSRAPLEFMKTLPLQHPYGFPCAVKCVLTDEEAHDH